MKSKLAILMIVILLFLSINATADSSDNTIERAFKGQIQQGDISSIVHDCGHIGASWLNHHDNDQGYGIWCIADMGFVLLPIVSSKWAKVAADADNMAVARLGERALQMRKILKEAGYTEEVINRTMNAIGWKVISKGGAKLGLVQDIARIAKEHPEILLNKADNEKLIRLIRKTGFELEDGTKYTMNAKMLENSQEEIQNAIMLKQGKYYPETETGYGALKILGKHGKEFRSMKAFGPSFTDEQILDVVEEVAQTAPIAKRDISSLGEKGVMFKKFVTRYNRDLGANVTREVDVLISDDQVKKGWVITGYPVTK